MMKEDEDELQARQEKGLMRQIKHAENKRDMGSFNFLSSELAARQREYDIALEYCEKALAIEKENPKYLLQMGLILNRLGRFQDAIEFFDRVLEVENRSIGALKGKGWALGRLRENQEAIDCYEKVLELDLNDFEAWNGRALALSYLGEYNEALKCFERALEIEPDHYKTLRSKASTLSRLGKHEEAIGIFDRLLKRNPKDLSVIQGKATAYFYGKNPGKAIELFEEALIVLERTRARDRIESIFYERKKVNFLRKIGASYGALQKDEEALKWFDDALGIDPRDYNTLRDKGVSLSRLGRRKEALECFEKALQINPENSPTWREKGAVLSNLNEDRKAIGCYKRAIYIDSNDYHSWRLLGASLGKLGFYEEAKAALDKALRINPNDCEALREKGFYHFIQFEDEKAMRDCTEVLKAEPNDALAHLVLACILEIRGELRASLLHYERFGENATPQQRRKYLDQIDLKIERVKDRIRREKETPLPHDPEIQMVTRVQGRLWESLFEGMEKKEKDFKEFLTSQKSISNSEFPSFLAILKRWNSYTPLLPLRGKFEKGGGYYLYHKGRGIVIDPGFNFVENFYQEGFNFADIDAIVITHAHIDHTGDLESILTLVDRINKNVEREARREAQEEGKTEEDINQLYEERIKERSRRIDLFLNRGTYQKYKALISCEKMTCIRNVHELEAGDSVQYGDTRLFAMKAKHDEVLDNEYCLGYVIEVDGIRIAITGDTGWEVDGSIGSQYKEFSPDLMIVHIGSIRKEELQEIPYYYPTHLGLRGITKILDAVRPTLAVVSEFGEELKDLRTNIAREVGNVTGIKCLPGDIGLYIRIPDLAVFCEASRQFVRHEDIAYDYVPCKLADYVEIPKICYYKKELPFDDVKKLQFNEEIRKNPLPKRIEEM